MRYGRWWPIAPVDRRSRNGRNRGVAAIGSAKLNGSKGDSCRSAAQHAPEWSGNDF